MDKFDLIDIDESSLADVNLSNKQKNKIRRALKISLNRSLSSNSNLDIDSSLRNIYSIYNSLGPERDRTIHGIKHAKVIQKLILEGIDKKYSPPKETLVYKNFFNRGGGAEAKDIPVVFGETSFYYQLYITKSKILLLSFNDVFKLVNTYQFLVSDIKNVYLSTICDNNCKLTNENLIIEVLSKNTNILKFYLVPEELNDSNTLSEVLTILKSINIPSYKPHQNKSKVIILIFIIIFLLILCTIFYSLVLL